MGEPRRIGDNNAGRRDGLRVGRLDDLVNNLNGRGRENNGAEDCLGRIDAQPEKEFRSVGALPGGKAQAGGIGARGELRCVNGEPERVGLERSAFSRQNAVAHSGFQPCAVQDVDTVSAARRGTGNAHDAPGKSGRALRAMELQ